MFPLPYPLFVGFLLTFPLIRKGSFLEFNFRSEDYDHQSSRSKLDMPM